MVKNKISSYLNDTLGMLINYIWKIKIFSKNRYLRNKNKLF